MTAFSSRSLPLLSGLAKVKRQVPPDSEATATVNGLQQQLIQIGTDIRHISHELHPALLQEAGLPAALFVVLRGVQQRTGPPCVV